jgi:hypothetical protein
MSPFESAREQDLAVAPRLSFFGAIEADRSTPSRTNMRAEACCSDFFVYVLNLPDAQSRPHQ